MNVPGLIEIEYIDADSTGIPYFAEGEVSASNFSGDFLPVDFTPTTGGFTDDYQKDGAGNLYHTIQLSFFVPETTLANRADVDAMVNGKTVFRCTDPQGVKYVIGDSSHPARTSYTMQMDPAHTGRRGYLVTATCTNLNGVLIWTDETESSAS